MATGDVIQKFGTASDVTITLASLATDANLLTGRESTAVDNSAGYDDFLVSIKITTGTSPTTGKSIQVWAIASKDDGSNWPDVFDGTDSAETISLAATKGGICKKLHIFPTTSTSNQAYEANGISIRQAFGGIVPQKFVIFVTHDTAVNLNSTGGNHVIRIQPVYYNVAA